MEPALRWRLTALRYARVSNVGDVGVDGSVLICLIAIGAAVSLNGTVAGPEGVPRRGRGRRRLSAGIGEGV